MKDKGGDIMFLIFIFVMVGYFGVATLRLVAALVTRSDDEMLRWEEHHPYHQISNALKDSPDRSIASIVITLAIMMSIFALLSGVVGLLGGLLFSHALGFTFGGSLYFSIAGLYFLYRKIFKGSKFLTKPWWRSLGFGKKLKSLRYLLTPVEIAEAKGYQKELLVLVKNKDQKERLSPILSKIEYLIEKEMPRLIKRGKELESFILDIEKVLKRQKENGIAKGEKEMMKKSKENLAKFQSSRDEVESDIASILAFIDHSSAHIGEILDAYNDMAVERAEELMADVQQEISLLLQTQEELSEIKMGQQKQFDLAARQAAQDEVKQASKSLGKKRQEV